MSKQHTDNTGWGLPILRWFCPPQLLEEIEGDLLQRFERDARQVGIRSAKWRLLWNTVRFLRPSIIKRNKINLPMPLPLIQNNLTMTFRAMRKEKAFTSINIFGFDH